jgi:hypothetical protein
MEGVASWLSSRDANELDIAPTDIEAQIAVTVTRQFPAWIACEVGIFVPCVSVLDYG